MRGPRLCTGEVERKSASEQSVLTVVPAVLSSRFKEARMRGSRKKEAEKCRGLEGRMISVATTQYG